MKNRKAHRSEASLGVAKTGHSEALEKRLRAYAAGAGAVAAGLLAFSPPATAQIVVVPAHATVTNGSSPFPINIEGTTEFTLSTSNGTSFNHYCVHDSLVVNAASGAGVVAHGHSAQAGALKFGAVIGPADQFEAGKQLLARVDNCRGLGGSSGPFVNTANRFMGLKFELNGQVYYGWAGFSVVTANSSADTLTAVLTAYAYETTPNKAIYAGQSSDLPAKSGLLPSSGSALETASAQIPTLGVLALGSIGLDAWRKREAPEIASEK